MMQKVRNMGRKDNRRSRKVVRRKAQKKLKLRILRKKEAAKKRK